MKIVLNETIKYKGEFHRPESTIDVVKDLGQQLVDQGKARFPNHPVEKTAPKAAGKKDGADEAALIEKIEAAASTDELKALVPEDETRQAVVDAASARWIELEK